VRVRPDEHVVSDRRRVELAGADERVLHEHAASADLDTAVLGGDDRAEENARARADGHVAAQDRVRRDVGARVDRGAPASMLYKHGNT
jgi:hypothetical protein